MLWVLAFALALDLNGLELCSRLGPQKFLNFTFVLCLISWKFLSLGFCKRSRLGPQRLGIMLSVRTSKFLNFIIVLCLILWEFFLLHGLCKRSRFGPHRLGTMLSFRTSFFWTLPSFWTCFILDIRRFLPPVFCFILACSLEKLLYKIKLEFSWNFFKSWKLNLVVN